MELQIGDWIEANGDKIQITEKMLSHFKRTKSLMGIANWKRVMDIETSIEDLIPYLTNGKYVLALPYDSEEWLEAKVIGIDLSNNTPYFYLKFRGGSYIWRELYFQLNKNFPKHYKIKLK